MIMVGELKKDDLVYSNAWDEICVVIGEYDGPLLITDKKFMRLFIERESGEYVFTDLSGVYYGIEYIGRL